MLYPSRLQVQKSMRPLLNRRAFRLTYDTAFARVIAACGDSPRGREEVSTWISDGLREGYTALHEQGYAHSVEVWDEAGALVGGAVRCGDWACILWRKHVYRPYQMPASMPSSTSCAIWSGRGYWLIDCQMQTDHLARFGAESISRRDFLSLLDDNSQEPTERGKWTAQHGLLGDM